MLADTTQRSETGKTHQVIEMNQKGLHRLPAHSHEQWTEETDDLKLGQGRREYQLLQTQYKT